MNYLKIDIKFLTLTERKKERKKERTKERKKIFHDTCQMQRGT